MATRRKSQTEFDRVPPYNEDAERAVLGSVLLNPNSVGTALEILRGKPEEIFYFPAHQFIYEAILSLYQEARPIDAIVLKERLFADGHLEEAGGIAYIADLTSVVPTSANIVHYANIVLEKSLLRRLISACTGVIGEAFEAPADAQSLLDRAEGELFKIADQRQMNPVVAIGDMLRESVARIEKQIYSDKHVTGLATGFERLDQMTSGLQPSDMIVLAARPSIGKTAFALNLARNAAVKNGKNVLIFSLEMSKQQLVERLLCMQGGINSQHFRSGFRRDPMFQSVQTAAGTLDGKKIFIDDSPNITALDLRAKARRHVVKHGCDLIIVDYLQLMSSPGRMENRQVEIAEISRSIKGLARELSVPVLALSQLSREAERDETGLPKLSHLRESGAIEQDADVVLMLYRPGVKTPENESKTTVQTNLYLAKQRNGPTGNIKMVFEKSIQRFLQLADDEGSEPPPSYGDEGPMGEDFIDEDESPF